MPRGAKQACKWVRALVRTNHYEVAAYGSVSHTLAIRQTAHPGSTEDFRSAMERRRAEQPPKHVLMPPFLQSSACAK